jgi:hypothetical protein
MVVDVTFDNGKSAADSFRFVRPNERHETELCRPAEAAELIADLSTRSKALGAAFTVADDRVRVAP